MYSARSVGAPPEGFPVLITRMARPSGKVTGAMSCVTGFVTKRCELRAAAASRLTSPVSMMSIADAIHGRIADGPTATNRTRPLSRSSIIVRTSARVSPIVDGQNRASCWRETSGDTSRHSGGSAILKAGRWTTCTVHPAGVAAVAGADSARAGAAGDADTGAGPAPPQPPAMDISTTAQRKPFCPPPTTFAS